jgi:hypothetical protein
MLGRDMSYRRFCGEETMCGGRGDEKANNMREEFLTGRRLRRISIRVRTNQLTQPTFARQNSHARGAIR